MSTPIVGVKYQLYSSLPPEWRAAGRPSLAAQVDLFALEFTKPVDGNTGCRIPRELLTVWNGDMIVTTPGAVISGYLVLGRILVRAANVLTVDCIVEAQTVLTSTQNCIDTTHSAARFLRAEFCTVGSAAAPNIYINGIGPKSFTAYRCKIYDVVDGGSISDSTGNNDDVVFEGCLIDRLFYITPDVTHSDNRTHNDGVQSQGGPTNLRLQGCTIRGFDSPASTNGGSPAPLSGRAFSCVMLNTTPARFKSNVQILGCWLDGGSYSINGIGTDGGTIQIKRNKFGRNQQYKPMAINISLSTVWDIGTGADANVYEDTRAPLALTDTYTQGTSTIRRYY